MAARPRAGRTSGIPTSASRFIVSLVDTDDRGVLSNPATQRVFPGNTPPQINIDSPSRFRVGEVIELCGSATDAEDGPISNEKLPWQVVKHHASHTHPYLQPTSGNALRIDPAPENFAAMQNSFLEARLEATNSAGLSSTVSRTVLPNIVRRAARSKLTT